jgi:hypothetical protein
MAVSHLRLTAATIGWGLCNTRISHLSLLSLTACHSFDWFSSLDGGRTTTGTYVKANLVPMRHSQETVVKSRDSAFFSQPLACSSALAGCWHAQHETLLESQRLQRPGCHVHCLSSTQDPGTNATEVYGNLVVLQTSMLITCTRYQNCLIQEEVQMHLIEGIALCLGALFTYRRLC